MSHLVYICDSNPEVVEQINSRFQDSDCATKIFGTIEELQEDSSKNLPDIVLLNPAILNGANGKSDILQRVPGIAYATDLPPKDQLTLYNLGVKRVVVESKNLPDEVVAVTKRVLHRRTTWRNDRQRQLTYGNIQAFSLEEVLQNVLMEEKNLILKVRYKNWDVKIRSFKGHIVNAFSPNLSDAEAVLKTLQLPAGSFVIRGYQKMEEHSSMYASTYALIAEARFEQKIIQEFLEIYGGQSSNPEFHYSEKTADNLSEEESIVLELIKTSPHFQDLLFDAPLTVLKTIRALQSLCQNKFITATGEGDLPQIMQPEDIDLFREQLFPEGISSGNLAVLGAPGVGRRELIGTLAGNQKAQVKTMQSVYLTRINLKSDLTLTVFGLPVEEAFLPVLDKISEGLVGCIFMIDFTQAQTFEFVNYLFTRLVQIYSVPFVIGLTNAGSSPEKAITEFRKHFTVPENVEVVAVNPNEFGDVRELLLQLKPDNAEEGASDE